jgi:TonB-like protein
MTKKKSMYSVAQVLRPDFGRSWHEAVAIVQEVASQLSPGLAVPAPEDLLFEDNALVFGFGSESDELPVTSLAVLLQGLLEGIEAPGGLRDLATENAKPSPAHTTVQGFSRALAFYERPNRANDLSAIGGRLRGAKPVDAEQTEFAKLRERVSRQAEEKHEEEQPSKGTEPKKESRQLSSRQKALIAAASAAAVLLIAFAGFARGSGKSVTPGVLERTEDVIARTISKGLDRMGGVTAAAPSVEPRTAEAPERELPRDRRSNADDPIPTSTTGRPLARDIHLGRSAPSLASPPHAAAAEPSRSSPVVTPVAPLPTAPAPSESVPPALLPAPTNAGNEGAIYSRADPGVQPPAFIRPQMPKDPPPGVDTGYFDIVVSQTGDVEQVQLVSPTRKFQERMLMAAAKAWKFRPAMLNGQPVKYRLKVPIILTGMP